MAAADSILRIIINADASGVTSGLAQAESKFTSFASKAAGVLAGAFAVNKMVTFVQDSVQAASALQDAMGTVDVVFKENAAAIHSWAADATDNVRLPQGEYERFAATLGSQFKSAGVPMTELGVKTHDTMQLAADLAAQMGIRTSDAVAVLTSAFKGNYEMLDQVNVSTTAAKVQARALELAQGNAALAATDMYKQNAVLSIIAEQQADAMGAAAREAGNFAAKQESATERIGNMQSAIGTALLPALSSFLGGIGDVATMLTPLGVGLAEAVGWLLQLPGPIIAFGAAIAGLALANALGMFSKLGSAFETIYLQSLYARDAMRAAAGGATGMTGALRTVGSAAQSAGRGLLNMIGGAPGAALLGIGVVIAAVAIAIQRVSDAAAAGTTALKPYVDALVESGNASTDATAAAFKNSVLQSDAFKALISDGFTATESVKILSGTIQDWQALQQTAIYTPEASNGFKELDADTLKLVNGFIDANGAAGGLAAAQIEGAAAMGINSDATGENEAANKAAATAAADLKAKVDELSGALKLMQDKAKFTFEFGEGNAMLTDLATKADAASRATELLNARFDELSTRSANEGAVVAWTRGLQDLTTAFKGTESGGGISATALASWNVVAMQGTEDSRNLYDSLTAQTGVYRDLVTGAFNAAGGVENMGKATDAAKTAANNARGEFIKMATDILGSGDQAKALADKLGILDSTQIGDKIFDVIADDNEAAMKVKLWETITFDEKTLTFVTSLPSAQVLADEMNAKYATVAPAPVNVPVVPDQGNALPGAFGDVIRRAQAAAPPVTITPNLNSAPAVASAAGIAPAVAAGPQPVVTTTADTAPAAAQIGAVTSEKRQTFVNVGAETVIYQQAISALIADTPNRGPAIVKVSADVVAVNNSIRAVLGGTYNTVVHIKGDIGPVNAMLRAVISGFYTTTVHILGDAAPVAATLRAVVSAQYFTWVRILGDASQVSSALWAIVTGYYAVTVHIFADTGPIQAALWAIANGYYTATVRVVADSSSFYSTFNSLPTTRAIVAGASLTGGGGVSIGGYTTLTGSGSLAGYGLSRTQTGGGGLGNTSYVRIDGGLDDPDSMARRLTKVLRDRSRRSSGVLVV